MSSERALRVSGRVYKALLVLYPRQFRREYGPHMIQVFRDSCRDEVGRTGAAGLVALWARTFSDLLSTAFTERGSMTVGRIFAREGFAIPFVSSPRMARWGGIMAVVGGLLGLVPGLLHVLSIAYLREPYFLAFSRWYEAGSSPVWWGVLVHPAVRNLLTSLAGLLVAVGVVGLYALVAHRSGKTALLGGVLACLSAASAALFVGANIYQTRVVLGSGYDSQTHGLPITDVAGLPILTIVGVGGLIGFVGLLLLGMAAFGARALGRWSILPLTLGLLVFLLSTSVPSLMSFFSDVSSYGGTYTSLVLPELPGVLQHLGWILLGYLLWSRGRSNEPREVSAT